MTKTNKENSRHRTPFYRRPWVIITFGCIVIVAIILWIIFANQKTNPEPGSSNQSSTSESSNPQAINHSSDKSEEKVPEPENKVTQFEGEDPNDLDELTGSVTYKGVHDGVLIVSTMINQYLTTEGVCELSLIDQSGVSRYTTTMPAIADVTSSVCQTFNIPISSLNSGKYQINIRISSDQKTGTITDEVEL